MVQLHRNVFDSQCTYTCIILNTPLFFPNFTSSRNSDDDLMCRVVFVIQTSKGDTNSGESGQRKSPSGILGRSPVRESGGQTLTICERGFHGEHAECMPITGVWAHWGWSPHRGPGAEPPPLEAERKPFGFLTSRGSSKFAVFCVLFWKRIQLSWTWHKPRSFSLWTLSFSVIYRLYYSRR